MVSLAFYKGKGNIFDKVVRWRTNCQYSHVELYLSSDGSAFSSSQNDGGTRWKKIDFSDSTKWDVVPVPGVSEDAVKAEIAKYENRKYDIKNILKIMAGIRTSDTSGILFCSEVCVRILQTCKYGIGLKPDEVLPDNLMDYAKGYLGGWLAGRGAL